MLEATSIIIDDREKNNVNYQRGFERLNIPASVQRLNHGDFFWHLTSTDYEEATGTGERYAIYVERKTYSDFINSAADGRLERFSSWVPSPAHGQGLKFILLESANKRLAKAGFNKGWNEDAIDNAMLEAQMRGIYVVRCNGGEVVKRVASLYLWLLKNKHQALARLALSTISNGGGSAEYKSKLKFLMAFSGIGEGTARSILAHFGGDGASLSAIVNDLVSHGGKEILQVKGIGQKTVNDMKKFLE